VAAVAVFLAWGLEVVPAIGAAGRGFTDRIVALGPDRAPDPGLLLVSVDEASLERESRMIGELAPEMGRAAARMLDLGARGVAFDLLLPSRWGESPPFVELLVRHPDRVVLSFLSEGDRLVGTEAAEGLVTAQLGPERAGALFATANVVLEDGVVRRVSASMLDVQGHRRPTLAGRVAAFLGGAEPEPGEALLDPRLDARRLDRVSWKDVESVLARDPGRFRERVVLVGTEYLGSGDAFRRSGRPDRVSGLVLQALAASSLRPPRLREAGDACATLWVASIACLSAWVLLLSAGRSGVVSRALISGGCFVGAAWGWVALTARDLVLPWPRAVIGWGIAILLSLLLARILPGPPVTSAAGRAVDT
jgi:CHASE2 domain-containing sensor protein